ncbi:MAG: hypothetical protein HZC36_09590 [Armatimonadetes bacterium]|nr:hypothetical protein [Armatimonadota bacterium]
MWRFSVLYIALAIAGVASADSRLDTALGGLKIGAERDGASKYDARQKLYLLCTGECDGAHLRIVLSGDTKAMMKNEGILYPGLEKWEIEERVKEFNDSHKPGKIKAETNHGVRLGMTETEVQRILGKPYRTMWSKKFQARELIYGREEVWPKVKGEKDDGSGTGMRWRNYYLFRNGRLFYIELSQDLVGGAC